MPPYRYDTPVKSKWGSGSLNHDAYIFHRPTNNEILFHNLGKITGRFTPETFRDNDGTVLRDDICSARKASSSGTATGAAAARAAQPKVQVQEYLGRVKSLEGDNVIAEIGRAGDMDRWDVIIPRSAFTEQPNIDEEIACRIVRWGSHAEIKVQILRNEPLPDLKDFGIDEENLQTWVSQLDV